VIRVHEDGLAVSLHIAAAEIGQGSDTILPQIAAEELGIPYDQVWMVECDSVLAPIDLGSYSSRVTLMGGNAVRMAAAEVKAKLLKIAGRRLGCDPQELTCRDGKIYIKEYPSIGMEWSEAAVEAFSQSGPLVGTGWYRPPSGLGVVVDRCVDFSDAGTVINPVTFHGQVEGAIIMGLGETLLEEVIHNPDGTIANPNLHDYLIPSIRETPETHSAAVESFEPRGPFGAKEVGEGSLLPVISAIANAIYDACGVRVKELPITPEKILRGLKEQQETSKEH
jgi:4-hydroxybenzoyl-CoA reductase subunit alpha